MRDLIREEFDALRAATFQEHAGLVLRDGAWTEDTLSQWRLQFPDEPAKIESVINHVHLRLLYWQPCTLDIDEVRDVGRQIRDAWRETLFREFPDRRFEVMFYDEVAEDGSLDDFEVTVFQVRPA